MMKKCQKFFTIFLIAALTALFCVTLPGCAGGSSSGGGGSSGGGATTSATTNPQTPVTNPAPESTPTPIPTPTPTPNKGALITISMPDHSASAVIVGVANYPGTDKDLKYSANDATDFKNTLVNNALWSGAVVTIQNDINITKQMISDAVTNASADTSASGTFVFYYSGYGSNSGDTGYLIPYDGIDDVGERISEDNLQDWLELFSDTVKKCVFIDSSASGHFIDKNINNGGSRLKFMPIGGSNFNYKNENFMKSLAGISNNYVITGSKGTEGSWEFDDLQNGVFTYYLCKGLGAGAVAGPADTNMDNIVSAEELTAYLAGRVNDYVIANKPGFTQAPQSQDDYSGSLTVKGVYPFTAGGDCIIAITMPESSAYALFVGVKDYPGTINDLNYTVADAIDLRDALKNSSFWSGAYVNTYNNIRATKSAIQTVMTNIKNNVASDGLFMFFYSGHGTNSDDIGYIIPYDGITDGGLFDASKAISEDELRSWINDCPSSSKKYILIDSCMSGHFIDKSNTKSVKSLMKARYIPVKGSDLNYKNEKFAKSLVEAQNTYVMTACKSDEYSWEFTALQNGVFTYYLSQGLGAGATIGPADANSNNNITAEELTSYVPWRVSNYVNVYGLSQQPQTYDNYSGELRIK